MTLIRKYRKFKKKGHDGEIVWNASSGTVISNRVPFLNPPVSLIDKPVIERIFSARKSPKVFSLPGFHSKSWSLVSGYYPNTIIRNYDDELCCGVLVGNVNTGYFFPKFI